MLNVRIVLTRNVNFIIKCFVDVRNIDELYNLLEDKERKFFKVHEAKQDGSISNKLLIMNKESIAFVEEQ